MDILRNLFGSLTSGIIRLLVTVGILGAAYLFILKPILHSADKAVESANRTLGGTGLNGLSKTLEGVSSEVQQEIRRSFSLAKKEGNPKRLVKCIQHAEGNAHKIQRCTVKF
jgi:hypothetical protein